MLTRRSRFPSAVIAAVVLLAGFASAGVPSAGATVSVTGAGSTWGRVAIDQWRADAARNGLSVNYQGVGSTAGRVFYYQDQVDFAVSEIPFQHELRDNAGNIVYYDEVSRAAHRPYAYVPLVAGATTFMYHLDVNGQRVRDLSLGPSTLAGIFTGEITNWNDARIRNDTGRTLPSLPIVPVLGAEGETTLDVTGWFANSASATWSRYCSRVALSPCGAAHDIAPTGAAVVESGSDGVAGYVAKPSSNGAITYVARPYAEQRGYPVASVRNTSGRFMQPTVASVQAALSDAGSDPAGAPVLDGVYSSARWNAYPLAEFASAIVPTAVVAPFTTAKGDRLGRFLAYAVCAGQLKSEALGDAPLPRALVKSALQRIRSIPGAPAPPSVDACMQPQSGLPVITPGTASVTEGNSGTRTVNVPFSLSQSASDAVVAEWVTYVPSAAPPWAQAPTDFRAASGSIVFAAGQTTATVPIVVTGDTTKEADEVVVVSLQSASGATIGGFYGLGVGTIRNDD